MNAPPPPTGMRGRLRRAGAVFPLAVARIRSNGWLAAGSLAGAALATALAASAPIFMEAVRDQGLQRDLRSAPAGALDLRYEVTSLSGAASGVDELEAVLQAETEALAGEIVESRSTLLRSRPFAVERDAGPGAEAFLAWHSDFAGHLGAPAEAPPAWDGAGPLPVVLVGEADTRAPAVGEVLRLTPVWLDSAPAIEARVSARVDPPGGRTWLANDPGVQDWLADAEFTFWIDRDALLRILPAHVPEMRSRFVHVAFTAVQDVRADAAGSLRDDLALLEARLGQRLPHVEQRSQPLQTLTSYRDRFTVARGAILSVVLQVLAAIAVYLVIAATLFANFHAEDTARLRSRGAHPLQLVAIAAIAGTVLVLPAVALAPLIALGLIELMGMVPPFDASLAPFAPRLSAVAWGWAAGAGALALIAQIVPAWFSSRNVIVANRGRRRAGPAEIAQRRVVDGAFLGLAVLAIAELQRDDPTSVDIGGAPSVDLLAAATPAIFALALGLVMIRLFPVAAGLMGRLTTRLPSTPPILAFAYLSRAPQPYARVGMLLVLVGVVTVFAASFRATLDRSYDERALYAVGAPIRVDRADTSPEAVAAAAASLAGARADADAPPVTVAAVDRLRGRVASGEEDAVTVLAADTRALADVAFLRDDFADRPLAPAMRALALTTTDSGTVLPATARRFGLWVWFDQAGAGTSLLARMQDEDGNYWEYLLAAVGEDERPADELFLEPGERAPVRLLDSGGETVATRDDVDAWFFLDVDLASPIALIDLSGREFARGRGPADDQALRLVSLLLRTSGAQARGAGRLVFEAPQWQDGDTTHPLEEIETLEWSLSGGPQDGLQSLTAATLNAAPAGTEVAVLEWAEGGTDLILTPAPLPPGLPALVGADLLAAIEATTGDVVTVRIGNWTIPVSVAATAERFPTIGGDGRFLIIDAEAVREALLRGGTARAGPPGQGELWIDGSALTADAVARALAVADSEVVAAAAQRAAIEADPLLVAAWHGMFIAALAAVGVAAAFGVAVLTLVTVRARRTEWAIVRSMGFLPRQTLAIVATEYGIVVLAGLGVGVLAGMLADPILLELLELTPAGASVDPPLRAEVNWATVGFVLAGLGALYAGVLVALLFTAMRGEFHRALRGPA